MDLLSDVLREFPVTGSVTCRLERRAPWAVDYDRRVPGYHLLLDGACDLEVTLDDGTTDCRRLAAGDLVVLPHGHPHVLRDGPGLPEPAAQAVAAAQAEWRARSAAAAAGSAAACDPAAGRTHWICGILDFADAAGHPLLAALPPVLHVRADALTGDAAGPSAVVGPWLGTFLGALTCEAASGRPGAEVVLARLSDVLFVHAVRAHLAAGPDAGSGWLAALRHPGVARALALLHAHPERAWTVAALAREAAMSRSRFAAHFTGLVGRPPLDYLAAWRMTRARRLLREGREPIAAIAARLGYASEAAFGHAFRRRQGVAPGAFRRAARDGGAHLRPDALLSSGGVGDEARAAVAPAA